VARAIARALFFDNYVIESKQKAENTTLVFYLKDKGHCFLSFRQGNNDFARNSKY